MNRIMGESGIAPSSNGNGTMHRNGTAEKNGGAAVEKPGMADAGVVPESSGADTASAAKPQRDKMGRYIPGNNGGPGNPFGRQVAWNRRAILAAVSEEELSALVRKTYGMAMEGHIPATKLLLQYLVGKPQAGTSPDRVDHEEWEMRMEQPRSAEIEDQTANRYPHRAALMIVRAIDPCKVQNLGMELKRQCAEEEALETKRAAQAEKRRQHKKERQWRKRS